MQFIDRKAKYPGRWTMKKSDGTSEVVTLVRNDEPIVEGTPMNANTLNALAGTDTTLTISGMAADAKATGDAVGRLKEDLSNLNFYRLNMFNKLDADNILKDKYSADVNGNVVGENIFTSTFRDANGYFITPIIEVNEGDVIRSNGNFYKGSGVYADATGIIIGLMSNVTTSANYADFVNGWTVPSGVKYIRLIVAYNSIGYEETLNTLMITINNTIPSTYKPHSVLSNDDLMIDASQVENFQNISNQWSGKIACSLGTSLSQMGGWDNIVKSALGFSKFYNRGVGSTTLVDFSSYGISNYKDTVYINDDISAWDETHNSVFSDSAKAGYSSANAYYCGDDRINTLPIDADLVLIDLATNDAYNAIQNPSLVDWDTFMSEQTIPDYWNAIATDVSLFEGAFYNMINKVQNRCPNARIVVWGMLVNNLFTTQNNYLTKYMEMYERIQTLCRENGVVFVDTMMYEGANWFNFKSEYHTDSVHPATTDVATRGVANAIIGVLKNVYPKNYQIVA